MFDLWYCSKGLCPGGKKITGKAWVNWTCQLDKYNFQTVKAIKYLPWVKNRTPKGSWV